MAMLVWNEDENSEWKISYCGKSEEKKETLHLITFIKKIKGKHIGRSLGHNGFTLEKKVDAKTQIILLQRHSHDTVHFLSIPEEYGG